MSVSIVIPLINAHMAHKDFLMDLADSAHKGEAYELVLVLPEGEAMPRGFSGVDLKIKIEIVMSHKRHGHEGAVKRGLLAASGERIIVLEHPSVYLKEVMVHDAQRKNDTVVLGVFTEYPRDSVWEFFKSGILGKGLVDGHCAFRCLSRKQLDPILGRIYLDRDGFNTELAYIAKKLGVIFKIVPVQVAAKFPVPNLKMYWNLLRIRNWHFPIINIKDEHMSDKDMAEMFVNESHHWWFVAKALFMKKILRQWAQIKDGHILDAGCGTGHNMRFLVEGGAYVGVDVSAQALNFCQYNGHKTLVQGNLDCLPFKNNSFDLVLALDVIEHTQNPWVVIRQLQRVLRQDGRIIITVPACRFLFSPHDEALSHLRRYDPKDIRALLNEAGFEVEHINYLYFFSFFPVALIRIFRKLFVRDPKPSTDMYYLPAKWINVFLQKLLEIEVFFLCKIPFPIGTTVVAVARKKS